jgi:error-prone DNA polymerase
MFDPRPFVHLDVRSFFSLKDGACSPEDVAARAAALGMRSVALTDRDGLYGATRFVDACQKVGVRPILGASLTIEDGSCVVLLAADAVGYANLCRLITDAHMLGERGVPSLSSGQICAHAEGLLAVLGSASPVGAPAIHGRPAAAALAIAPFKDAFDDRLYVGVQQRLEARSNEEIRALLRVAERTSTRAVATNAVRYLVADDAFLADALECMRELVPINRHNVSRTNAEGWLKPAADMRRLFIERPELCDVTLEIEERCAFDLGLREIHFPEFPAPAGRSPSTVLAERCWRGIEHRGLDRSRAVVDRLNHELDMIHKLGYSAYFLTVADIVYDIRAMGIRCACRGSAAGSFVCYLTGISDVDPVRHDLVFERFINPLRDELPDIDIDVESARREDVYDMVLSRHGDDRTACVAMVETYRARAAVREAGKALGLPEVEVDTVAKAFPHIGAQHLRTAMQELPELAGSNMNAGQLETLFRVAERLNGFPRHLALHPSGIVLSNDSLVRRVPLERSYQGYRMIQADKDDVELLGYLKLDVLGVRMLSAMRHCLDEVARTEHEKVDLDGIPLDDPPTFELIRRSDTLGCFQIESPGQRELLQKFQPDRWDDLIVDISLFRPGPVKSDMITPFLKRRAGMQRPVYLHPSFRKGTQETYGVIVYHEQVMRTVAAVTGCDLSEADRVRRHLSDDLEVDEIREWFLDRASSNLRLSDEDAERIWHEVWSFASFGFCKAHAAAFAVPTYQSAWLKAHYPAHFLSGVLTHEPGMYPRRLILEDAREHGIPILPLDVNASESDYVVELVPTPGSLPADPPGGSLPADPPGGASLLPSASLRSEPLADSAARSVDESPTYGIRLALKDVHGISDREVRSILQARADTPFRDVGDFIRRVTVAQPVVEDIAHAGGFDRLPSGTRRDRVYAAMVTMPERVGDQMAFDLVGTPEQLTFGLPEYSDAERVRAELEVLGVDASRHLVSFFEPLLADLGVVRAADLWKQRSGARVVVAGVKVASQTPAVKSGQRIIFLTLDDATGPVDVTVFESAQAKVAKTIFHAFVLAVRGTVRRTGRRGVSIIAEDAWELTALHRARRDGTLAEALEGRTNEGQAPPRKLWHASGGSAGW